jgi:hypothetical protein
MNYTDIKFTLGACIIGLITISSALTATRTITNSAPNSEPFGRQVAALPDGNIFNLFTLSSIGLEADIAPRTGGDGVIASNDVVQIRAFLTNCNSIDTTTNEFQRADSAPLATLGDGMLASNDVVQARRYITTDAPQSAGGPTSGCPGSPASSDEAKAGAKPIEIDALSEVARHLRVESTTAGAGEKVTVNIRVDAVGDESEYAFVLNYQAPLSNPVVGNGTAGALLHNCNVATFGEVRCSVGGFTSNKAESSAAGIGEIEADTNRHLLTLTFTVATNAQAGEANLNLSGVNTSNDAAQLVAISAMDGAVTINGKRRQRKVLWGEYEIKSERQ